MGPEKSVVEDEEEEGCSLSTGTKRIKVRTTPICAYSLNYVLLTLTALDSGLFSSAPDLHM